MHSPGPSASDIQSHLYSSFLQASTYDVAIRVSGNWTAIYKLHRVVLIQSGFFRSLFTAGFAESTSRSHQKNASDEIHVVFDDYNITRPAFEICISRLYGGGPPLHISPNLIPSTAHPLTPPFSGIKESDEVPAGKQPATPRFLLSLLSTAIYLSIPAVASQALALILKTIGPTTVVDYLDFACGRSVTYSCIEPDEVRAAVGLEHVAQMIEETLSRQHSLSSIRTEGLKSGSPTPSTYVVDPGSAVAEDASDGHDGNRGHWSKTEPLHHYGAVSDKIGESCACWLARWAVDLLHLEAPDFLQIHDSRSRSQSLSSIRDRPGTVVPILLPRQIPAILRPGGLTAKWISALVSSDTLFVPNERGRYNFARSVVELRRRNGINEAEEAVWSKMFEEGIYYSNLGFEDILHISQDVSPTTKRPYVPLSVLQASHWTQSLVRQHVTYRSGGTSSPVTSSPSAKDKELGISFTTTELLTRGSDLPTASSGFVAPHNSNTQYYPVLGDMSLRIGDNGGHTGSTPEAIPSSMEDLFNPTSFLTRQPRSQGQTAHEHNHTSSQSSGRIQTTESTFFGLFSPTVTAATCAEHDPTGNLRWTPYPPYRFSVEFWDLDWLKEKSRLHSQTIWHAGSLFNVYVQVVRKKGQAQLGVYLHRQSHVDPIPATSTPSSSGGTVQAIAPSASMSSTIPLERTLHLRQPSLPSMLSQAGSFNGSPNHYSPSIHPVVRSTTPAGPMHIHPSPPSPSSSPPSISVLTTTGIPATVMSPMPPQPYRDPRSSISAYFAITCASATGSSQTRFSSSPDVFSVSQSWGWKSSSLRTEEFMEVGTQTLSATVSRGKEVSLRATVLLGLV